MKKSRQRTLASGRGALFTVVLALVVALTGGTASAGAGVLIDTELLSLNLTGMGALPLGDGYAPVQSRITVSLFKPSNTMGPCDVDDRRSCGTTAFIGVNPAVEPVLQGQQFSIFSSFTVFFDVTAEDIDPINNYGGGLPGTLSNIPSLLPPVLMTFSGVCTANLFEDNFGCLPPVGNVYQGHLGTILIDFPLMTDLNDNNLDDTLRIKLDVHAVGNVSSRTRIGGVVTDTFNSSTMVSGQVDDVLT